MTFPDWDGRSVVCIASGPSLTDDDCNLIRESGLPTIVTNTTYQKYPSADVIFGADIVWWTTNLDRVLTTCPGLRVCDHERRNTIDAHSHPRYRSFTNSGACAAALAVACGASEVILLGYDCQKTGGRWHHHPDHPVGRNCVTMKHWPKQFAELAKWADVPILNASRETALACFQRVSLEDVIPHAVLAA